MHPSTFSSCFISVHSSSAKEGIAAAKVAFFNKGNMTCDRKEYDISKVLAVIRYHLFVVF